MKHRKNRFTHQEISTVKTRREAQELIDKTVRSVEEKLKEQMYDCLSLLLSFGVNVMKIDGHDELHRKVVEIMLEDIRPYRERKKLMEIAGIDQIDTPEPPKPFM